MTLSLPSYKVTGIIILCVSLKYTSCDWAEAVKAELWEGRKAGEQGREVCVQTATACSQSLPPARNYNL